MGQPDFLRLNKCRPSLGTFVDISICADAQHLSGPSLKPKLGAVIEAGFEIITRLNEKMSFQNPNSELSKINKWAIGRRVEISSDLQTVLSAALDLSHQSGGVFDISIADQMIRRGLLPDHGARLSALDPTANWCDIQLSEGRVKFSKNLAIDLSGIAKGYVVDQAFKAIQTSAKSYGISLTQIIVNAGGDLKMLNWQDQIIPIRVPTLWGGAVYRPTKMQAPAMAVSIANHGHKAGEIIAPSLARPSWEQKITKKLMRAFTAPTPIICFADTCMMADAQTKIDSLMDEGISLSDP